MTAFDESLKALDLRLFEKIFSQSNDNDKRSLLAAQAAVREIAGDYVYLEIGSYLGGSIQPHLLDPRCRRIFSIDKRPAVQPDERGVDYEYLNNSTARMLENLKGVDAARIDVVTAIDGDSREIDVAKIDEKVTLCYIDGEHTDVAVMADFLFCLSVLDKNGAILFDDANIIYNGIADCLAHLDKVGVAYRAFSLPDKVFAVAIGDFPMTGNEQFLDRALRGYEGYLYSLQSTDYYRSFVNKLPFRLYRALITRVKGLNKFD